MYVCCVCVHGCMCVLCVCMGVCVCVCVLVCVCSRTTCSTVHPERRMRASSKSGGSTDRHTHCSALYGYRHTYACINTHNIKTHISINTTWAHVHITPAIQTLYTITLHTITPRTMYRVVTLRFTGHITFVPSTSEGREEGGGC